MAHPAKLHIVPSVASTPAAGADETAASATGLSRSRPSQAASSTQHEAPFDTGASSLQQAQVHAAAVARLLQEVEKLRHTEARLATDQLAAIERETVEIADLTRKAEQRVQAISNARIEDARIFLAGTNSRAVAEARARVVLRQRIAEEQRLHQLAQERAGADAEASRLAMQRGDAEAAAARRENDRCDAEQRLAFAAQQRLALNSAAAAVAEANLRLELDAQESAKALLAAEKREHDAQARKIEFEKRAAHEAMNRARLEAELAVKAKRRVDADTSAAASAAARIAAEHEAAELAEQQAIAEADHALAATAHRDELRAARDSDAAEAQSISQSSHAESATQRGRRSYLGRFALGFVAVALMVALLVPQFSWHQGTGRSAGAIGVAGGPNDGNQPVSAAITPAELAQMESGLPGLKMSDRFSATP